MNVRLQSHRQRRRASARRGDPLDVALGVLAHELRNPLAAIGLAASLLELHTRGDKRSAALLGAISSNVALSARLVDDLMQHSKVHSDGFRLQRSACGLRALLDECVAIALAQSGQTGRGIAVILPVEDIRMQVDRMRMQQVFVNLIANALRYTPDPGRIWLTAAIEGGEVVVHVSDEGVGIERERLVSLLEQSALPRLKGSGLGLGIGLILVKRIVELHGGSVMAHSEGAGTGSRFTVRLPACG